MATPASGHPPPPTEKKWTLPPQRMLWTEGNASSRDEMTAAKKRECADADSSLVSKRRYSAHLKFADIDAAMLQWVLEMNGQKVPLSDSAIQAKAKQLAQVLGTTDFKASNGWLYKFKERHGFVINKAREERDYVDVGHADCGLGNYHHALLDHDPTRVYSCCETSLLYKRAPFRDDTTETPEDRFTVLLCCNASGTHKIKPLVINCCDKGQEKLPVTFAWQRSSFMTSNIFQQWLWEFEKQVDHNSVLILDTCPAHVSVQSDNVKLLYIQSNQRELQPLYGGVLNAFKCRYRSDLVSRYSSSPGEDVSLRDATQLLADAWQHVGQEMIIQSWVKSQLLQGRMCAGRLHNRDFDPVSHLCANMGKIRAEVTRKDAEEYLHCDDTCSTTYSFSEEAIESTKPSESPGAQYAHGCPTNLHPGDILGMLDKMEHFFTHQALTSTTDLLAIHSLRNKTIRIATDFQVE
ncbi:tigger transposable element-derived protein 6-like [Ornithodoros turicata]|uniref:tigger transposable element-derived protein 6-like n=1 Tax=Ornithodoros turicata TaxID=34597 RepID=UPI003138FE98